jgi:hypothetical protein
MWNGLPSSSEVNTLNSTTRKYKFDYISTGKSRFWGMSLKVFMPISLQKYAFKACI